MFMTIYLVGAFLLSFVCGMIFTPIILRFCKKKGIYDLPNERKVHKNAIPRMGGLSFFPSMMVAFVVMLLFYSYYHKNSLEVNVWSASFLIGLTIIYFTGIVDDLTGLTAKTKFFVQIATACLLPMTGLYINNLYGLFGVHEVPAYVGFMMTIIIIVFIDNAINMIDGIDGLSASLSIIALVGFLCYFNYYDVFTQTYSLLIAGMTGALVAYLYFNLFGKPEKNTKIFMGDSGSLSLGFTIGFLAIKCCMNNTAVWPMRPEGMMVPITLLIVPSFDVIRVTIYRVRHHLPVFNADKNHMHHKMMQAGLTQHQALVCIIALALFIVLLNYLLLPHLQCTLVVAADVVVFSLFIRYFNQHNKNLNTTESENV